MSDYEIRLDNVRISFPVLFEAKAFNPGDKPRFSAHALFPKEHPQAAELKKLLQRVATDKWGEKGERILKQLIENDKVCLHDGNRKKRDDGDVIDGYADNYYLSASSQVRPTVVDRDRSQLSEADGRPYAGCYVNMKVALWAQDNQFGKRINAQLQGVQFVKDGEAFGGGRPASAEEFDTLEDEFGGSSDGALI